MIFGTCSWQRDWLLQIYRVHLSEPEGGVTNSQSNIMGVANQQYLQLTQELVSSVSVSVEKRSQSLTVLLSHSFSSFFEDFSSGLE